MPRSVRQFAARNFKILMAQCYWRWVDARDCFVEVIGMIPSHSVQLFLNRHIFGLSIGERTSIHRKCRFYRATGVAIGAHSVINRDILEDGHMSLTIGKDASISEGAAILSLEHDPNSPEIANYGAVGCVGNRVFIGARSLNLPGVNIGEGVFVAAGAVVTHDVSPYLIVSGVPTRPIGERDRDLIYSLDYRKFLG